MDRRTLDELKRRIPLLEYLQQQGWQPRSRAGGPQVAGLCPLHRETRASFVVHTAKNLFYCHGCGQGGDVIRLIQLLERLSFPQALARLRERDSAADAVAQAAAFYQTQLALHPEAMQYLRGRGIHDAESRPPPNKCARWWSTSTRRIFSPPRIAIERRIGKSTSRTRASSGSGRS